MNSIVNCGEIETERLRLESLNPDHADRLFEPFCDPDLYTYVFLDVPESPKILRERYEYICRGRSKDGKQIWLNWAAKHRTTEEYCGFFEATIEGDCATLAYFTFRPYQRMGLAKEGVEGIMAHIQQNYLVNKFVLEMDTRNRASVRLAESLGFVWERTTNHACDLKGYQSHEFTYGLDLRMRASFLKKHEIRDYICFRHPSLTADELEARALALSGRVFGNDSGQESIILVKQVSRLVGAGYLLELQPGSYGIANIQLRGESQNPQVFEELMAYAISECSLTPGARLCYRLLDEPQTVFQRDVLEKLGFRFRHQRTEFRRDLCDLPDDKGTLIHWEQPDILDDAAYATWGAFLDQIGQGDPDFDASDDGAALLRAYMRESGLTSGPASIHMGKVDGANAAIVIAQVEKDTGWSRITYMGLLPEFRGRGFGKWVHRHGFQMLRDQGGKLYHGGTLTENKSMMRLFERHGCEVFRILEEWEFQTS